jgi:hypothetical protein
MNLTIGSKVWIFNMNHREYSKDTRGHAYGPPIYRAHFVEREIIGETRVSWILNTGEKINKKQIGNPSSTGLQVWVSEADVDATVYVHDNASKIADKVRSCRNPDLLKRIEELVDADKTERHVPW